MTEEGNDQQAEEDAVMAWLQYLEDGVSVDQSRIREIFASALTRARVVAEKKIPS